MDVHEVIELIRRTYPNSRFRDVNKEWIATIEKRYSSIPANLRSLYEDLGYGGIGPGHYSIHVLMDPDEIYDLETAAALKGKLIVGDDFAGCCQAYDTQNNWEFGYIESTGEFESFKGIYDDFIAFLHEMTLNETKNSD